MKLNFFRQCYHNLRIVCIIRAMDDPVWMRDPFQLLNFLIIGEQYVTLNKVTNAIARIGLGIALVMAIMGNKSWWMVGLSVLFVSILFHYSSVYSGCQSTPTSTTVIVEGFQPTTHSDAAKVPDEHVALYESAPSNDQSDIEFLEEPRFQPSGTMVSPQSAQTSTTVNGSWKDFKEDARRQVEDSEIQYHEDQVSDNATRLQLNLTPDDFQTNFFEPYTIYRPNEALYASMSV